MLNWSSSITSLEGPCRIDLPPAFYLLRTSHPQANENWCRSSTAEQDIDASRVYQSVLYSINQCCPKVFRQTLAKAFSPSYIVIQLWGQVMVEKVNQYKYYIYLTRSFIICSSMLSHLSLCTRKKKVCEHLTITLVCVSHLRMSFCCQITSTLLRRLSCRF